MPREPDPSDYASVRLTHHATVQDRDEEVRRRPGRRSTKPECLVIGHAWTEDASLEGGTICLVCQVVRLP